MARECVARVREAGRKKREGEGRREREREREGRTGEEVAYYAAYISIGLLGHGLCFIGG